MASLGEGLKISIPKNYQKLIVEGDSIVIITMLQKIIHGTPPNKVSRSWKLSSLVETLLHLLQTIVVRIPSHLKMVANKLVDYLTNVDMNAMEDGLNYTWQDFIPFYVRKECNIIAHKDWIVPLDGMVCAT